MTRDGVRNQRARRVDRTVMPMEHYVEQPIVLLTKAPASRSPSEFQMSKRKRRASKHARSPKIASKAHRATQAVVRSPRKNGSLFAAPSTKRPPEHQDVPKPPEHHEGPKQESPPAESPVMAVESKQMTTDNGSKKQLNFFPWATTPVLLYQAKLLELVQGNVQLAFEFAQRLATSRSPVDFFAAVGLLTSKRIDMYVREVFKRDGSIEYQPVSQPE
jgi:hypothetical protein